MATIYVCHGRSIPMAYNIIRRKKHRKLAIGIIIFFFLFCLISMAACALLFGIMFGRNEIVPNTLELSYNETDKKLYPREDIRFPSGKNMLQAYYYPRDKSPGIIVMVHGIHGGADTHLSAAKFFLDMGWSVFCFDGTGTRQSEGRSTVGLSQMKLDLMSALDYLSSSYPSSPLLLYGHSMGAYASATVLNDRDDVCAAALLCGFESPAETMYYHATRYAGPFAALGYPFMRLYNSLIFGAEANESASDAISNTQTAVLICHGNNDEVIPEDISIYGQEQLISNPNVSRLLISEEYRNLHSSLWLSSEAAEYRTQLLEKLDLLNREYGNDIPPEISSDFFSCIDKEKLYGLDIQFMNEINSFFIEAIK